MYLKGKAVLVGSFKQEVDGLPWLGFGQPNTKLFKKHQMSSMYKSRIPTYY